MSLRQPIAALLTVLATNPILAQSTDSLLRNAMSAAPVSLSKHATIMDGHNQILRAGANGWICIPDNPSLANNSPMCIDTPWLEFVDDLMAKRPPKVTRLGIGYMLQGDMPVSNVDPFATGPTDENDWVPNAGPHIMIILPDAKHLDGLSTDPKNGGPWVMWKGTPWAHVMIPTAPRAP